MEQSRMKIFGVDTKSAIEADLNAIRETAYLLSIPGMCDAIKVGMAQLPGDMAKSLDW